MYLLANTVLESGCLFSRLFFAEVNILYGSALMTMSVDGANATKFRNIPALEKIVQMTFDPYDDSLFYIGKGYFDTGLMF